MPVGALRSLTIACALLALVPATVSAQGAAGDLTVSVSRLDVPARIKGGKPASFGVRYIVRGPTTRTAFATVDLSLTGPNVYRVNSLPAKVRPAIWKWNVQDTMPAGLAAGKYVAVATVTLKRAGKTIARTSSSQSLRVDPS
jgi:hypothetical protein